MKISEILKRKKNVEFDLEQEKQKLKERMSALQEKILKDEMVHDQYRNKIANVPTDKDARTRFFLALDRFVDEHILKYRANDKGILFNAESFQAILGRYNLSGVFAPIIESMPSPQTPPVTPELKGNKEKLAKLQKELADLENI